MRSNAPIAALRGNGRMFLALLGVALLSFGTGLAGARLVEALQLAPLPAAWSGVVRGLLAFSTFAVLLWLVVAVVAPFATIVLMLFPHLRRLVPLCAVAWASSWGSYVLRDSFAPLRRPGLIRVMQNARPLIVALERFKRRNGRYPAQLQELVPSFLPRVPASGIVCDPAFRYRLADGKSLFGSYELKLRTSRAGINFDVFVFWPKKHYPPQMYGGSIERIGDWAYVHE